MKLQYPKYIGKVKYIFDDFDKHWIRVIMSKVAEGKKLGEPEREHLRKYKKRW